MNSDLYNKSYNVPDKVIKHLEQSVRNYNDPSLDGYKRATNLIKSKKATYQQLKRIKNYFDNLPQEHSEVEYNLNGGDPMKEFVNSLLTTERKNVERSKSIRSQGGLNNSYKDGYERDGIDNDSRDVKFQMKESIKNLKSLIKEELEKLKRVALGVVFNRQGQLLILQRPKEDHWMPNKWSHLGGGIENGETAQQALIREIKEESGINEDKLKVKFKSEIFNLEDGVIQYIFLVLSDEEDLSLNKENQDYMWIDWNDLDNYELVPNFKEYVKTVIQK